MKSAAYKKHVKHNVALSIRGKRLWGVHGWTWRLVHRPWHKTVSVPIAAITDDTEIYTWAARLAATRRTGA